MMSSNLLYCQGKLQCDYQLSKTRLGLPGFNIKTTVLSGATCLVSNGNNISSRALPTMKARQILKRDKRPWPVLVCCFACSACYDFKGRQVAS